MNGCQHALELLEGVFEKTEIFKQQSVEGKYPGIKPFVGPPVVVNVVNKLVEPKRMEPESPKLSPPADTEAAQPKKWYEQWWAISVLGGVFVALIVLLTKEVHWIFGVFGLVTLIIFLFFNPKRRFFRTASSILSGIVIAINVLPALDLRFNWTENLPDGNLDLLFNLGIEENTILNLALIGLAAFLFWLDSREN